MSYRIRLDPLAHRQISRWELSDGLLVDVHLRLNDDLSISPKDVLRPNTDMFDDRGMMYGFELIDLENRMLVHDFRFQVFYLPDEQTLLVARAVHVTRESL